ncbi:hypothetical protein CHRYSEO8AT_40003 [Chryseobacterium sp. 8AT]|nr:hypothetical protein CHRYSEO8AT_40003 [Chryseobacterium sp. 8AT]
MKRKILNLFAKTKKRHIFAAVKTTISRLFKKVTYSVTS